VADAIRLLGRPLATGKPVGFAIVDADFREGDGIEAARLISADGRLPVVVLLRTTEFGERATRCRESGLRAVIAKPVSPRPFAEAVRRTLGLTGDVDAALAAAPGSSAHGKVLDVLLAEDNVVNQKLAMRMLERLGHRVTLARNGEEAVELATHEHFDVILMDVQMPVLGGIDATRAIRAHEKAAGTAPVPVVAHCAGHAGRSRAVPVCGHDRLSV
jgi:CheY-like chemotaxis protein